MRSRPYTTPAPLPPVLHDLADELAHIIPNQRLPYATDPNGITTAHSRTGYPGDTGVELGTLDPETSRLLPVPAAARRKRHHVRVQGKLALVRSASTVNLRPATATTMTTTTTDPVPPVPKHDPTGSNVTVVPQRSARTQTRRSLDDRVPDSETETESDNEDAEQEKQEVRRRDGQLRGYGIGGAGNIRRPTDVVQFSPRRDGPMLSLPMLSPTDPDRKKWRIRQLLGLAGDRNGKRRSNSDSP